MAKARPKTDPPRTRERGNYVGEWFGHRVYPNVCGTDLALSDERTGRCPFLSLATGEDRLCIKSAASSGICTISSASTGKRHDWLVCPYRALEPSLLENAARRLFGLYGAQRIIVVPAPTLAAEAMRSTITDLVEAGDAAIVYIQSNLGGEISIAATAESPEMAFDIMLVEIIRKDGILQVGRYGILEVQTMDFHGSYRRVVTNLKDALRLHDTGFHEVLRQNPGWLADGIESPNIANVFKRTFYQMLLKFRIGAHESCAGSILAIPVAVWESWQRHLGSPRLLEQIDGTFSLLVREGPDIQRISAWIYLFDIAADCESSPAPIEILKVIATDTDSLLHYAVKVAPDAAVASAIATGALVASIRKRLSSWWPALQSSPPITSSGS